VLVELFENDDVLDVYERVEATQYMSFLRFGMEEIAGFLDGDGDDDDVLCGRQ